MLAFYYPSQRRDSTSLKMRLVIWPRFAVDNDQLFNSIQDASSKIELWRRDYNEVRPHSSLGQVSTAAFAQVPGTYFGGRPRCIRSTPAGSSVRVAKICGKISGLMFAFICVAIDSTSLFHTGK